MEIMIEVEEHHIDLDRQKLEWLFEVSNKLKDNYLNKEIELGGYVAVSGKLILKEKHSTSTYYSKQKIKGVIKDVKFEMYNHIKENDDDCGGWLLKSEDIRLKLVPILSIEIEDNIYKEFETIMLKEKKEQEDKIKEWDEIRRYEKEKALYLKLKTKYEKE